MSRRLPREFRHSAESPLRSAAMQYVITAVGPDNRGLADPIVHCVTQLGANIAEIQMFDHDEESVFSMLTRVEIDPAQVGDADGVDAPRSAAARACRFAPGRRRASERLPRLAICATLSHGDAARRARGDPRRRDSRRGRGADQQSAGVPRAGRRVRRAVALHRRRPRATPTTSG